MGGHGKKWVWSVWLRGSKIDFISKMNRWYKLIFLHSVTNPGKLNVDSMNFEWAWSKVGHGLLVYETLKSAL